MLNPDANARRASCPRCQRPLSTCLCRWITPIDSDIDVVILQHPLEVNNAKNSARLLHLSLVGSRLAVAEIFPETELRTLVYGAPDAAVRRPLLLYPHTPEQIALGLTAPPDPDRAWTADPAPVRLVVLDGTWRKSRKMLYLNPLLQSLPRLALHDTEPSRYRIRKAHKVDQLSTLEACCHGLMQLDAEPQKFARLLDAFDGFVEQQTTVAESGKMLNRC